MICTASVTLLTLGDAALQARIECITREDGDELRLAFKPSIAPIVVYKCLESRDTADGLGGRRVYVVDIVVVEQPDVWRSLRRWRWFKDQGFAFWREHVLNQQSNSALIKRCV